MSSFDDREAETKTGPDASTLSPVRSVGRSATANDWNASSSTDRPTAVEPPPPAD